MSARSQSTVDQVSGATATATLSDTINVVGPVNSTIFGAVHITINGTIIPGFYPPQPLESTAWLSIGVGISSSFSSSHTNILLQDRGECPAFGISHCETGGGNYSLCYTIPFEISPLDKIATIIISATTSVAWGGESLFGDTAYLNLILPEGLAFTSQTGFFLTNQNTNPIATPEPTSLLLFASGLVAFAATHRRRSAPAV